VSAEIAKACFKNNIHDFDIFENEGQLEKNYQNSKDMKPVENSNNLISLITKIFLWEIKLKERYASFSRLKMNKEQMFYSMFLEWRSSGTSYNEMINQFIRYWNKKDNSYIYVGTKWGEITSPYNDGVLNSYIDLSEKTLSQKVNDILVNLKHTF
jgi:hypothetical protein